jgi:signal transduction histidine kinase
MGMADGGPSQGDVRVLSRLLAVSAELGRARTAEQIARVVIELGIDAVGASYGGIWLLDSATRRLRMLAVSKLPRGSAERWSELSLDVDAPIPDAIRSGEPIFVTLAEYERRYAASLARIRDVVSSPDPAYANLPLRTGAGTLGALALTYERAADLDATERMFLTILANQCAIALERVQLDEAERHARHLAEEATRAREEILSMVSHDLRNPLGTILMGAQTLLQIDDPLRMRTTAERIHRQAERMARLIEDLVDFAAIQAGKITLDRRPHAPDAIVRAAAELFAPLAAERDVRFDVRATPDQPPIMCDAERAVQVLSNLLSNALKVTPRNGAITLGAEPSGVFYVRDTGPGIEPDELPRLFERYWRSKHSTYKGAGLGLSIAKGIVDAHGGTISVTSAPGAGSTFRFTLG